MQARAADEEAKAAIIHQLDDNLREEQRLWCQQDRELFAILSPLQVGDQAETSDKAMFRNSC